MATVLPGMLVTGLLLGGALYAWAFLSVQRVVAKKRPLEPFNSVRNRNAVEPYVWSPEAPRSLRRCYIVGKFFGLVGALCGGGLGYVASRNAFEIGLIGVWSTAVVAIGGHLVWKVRREGF